DNPEHLKTLSKSGSFSIRISLDAEHQERVPFSLLFSLIEEALALDIEVNFTLRCIPGRKDCIGDFLDQLSQKQPDYYHANINRSRWLHRIPHMPINPESPPTPSCASEPAATPGEKPAKAKWRGRCKIHSKDMVIGEDGLIYPCCGFPGMKNHTALSPGTPPCGEEFPGNHNWDTIEKNNAANPISRILREKGPYAICKEMNLDPETWKLPPFEIPCHVCLPLFHRHGEQVVRHYAMPPAGLPAGQGEAPSQPRVAGLGTPIVPTGQ
ncbi:MAG: hypothetical protein GY765_10200, partial [bacterium]|nr:hypothetical protein [bacterium]